MATKDQEDRGWAKAYKYHTYKYLGLAYTSTIQECCSTLTAGTFLNEEVVEGGRLNGCGVLLRWYHVCVASARPV